MRHAIGWAELQDARVGVFGAGVEGLSALGRLTALTSDVVVVDDDPGASLVEREVVASASGGIELLRHCDVVIKSPGISRYRNDVVALESAGIPVVGGTGLSIHELVATRVVCITGTKGKSTTASVLGHLLGRLGVASVVTGNIGLPLFDPSVPTDAEVYVVETSSFQALDVADAPGVVVVTSLAVDHVDWHGSAEQYQRDKLSLSSLEGAGITIAQGSSPLLRERAAELGGELRWSEAVAGDWATALGLLGRHNLANAELARLAIEALDLGIELDDEALAEASEGFRPLLGRLSDAGSIGGVRFIDDSLATNVLPTLAALESLAGERLAILLGGFDRGVRYDELIEALAHRGSPTFVVGLPDTGARLVAAIASAGSSTQTALAKSVTEATTMAFEWARPDGVVLLSPAAPSFSQFANWKERSQAFRDQVALLEGG